MTRLRTFRASARVLADKLREESRLAGISPSAIAHTIGVPVQSVHQWFRGEHTPSIDRLAEVAAVLGLEVRLGLRWKQLEPAIPATEGQRAAE